MTDASDPSIANSASVERARRDLAALRVQPTEQGSPQWVWEELGADELRVAWQELAVWLAAEVEAHAVTEKVPASWWRYPALVRQLAALHEWQRVANRPGAHPREIVDWDEGFYRMVDSLWPRYAAVGDRHDDLRRRDRVQRADEELARYVAAAVADRGRPHTSGPA